jgi:predicted transcriptional regulator of viral defense system
MSRINYLEQIKNRIILSQKGSVFITSDFFDIADTDVVNKCLSRLEKANIIRRVTRGVYEFPEYSEFLNEYIATSPDKVAHALARNFGWTIAPSGNTALNLLGLSTQVPAVWSYVSDGTYKTYEYDRIVIKFKHTTNKDISGITYKTALVIQAIKSLGKDNIDNKKILKLSKDLTKEEKSKMLIEAKHSTAWIYKIIKKICNWSVQDE